MKTGPWVVGMAVLGVVALAIPAWLYEWRTNRPLEVPERAEFAVVGEGGGAESRGEVPVAVEAVRGLARAVASAAEYLTAGRRAEGTHALDAAQRMGSVVKAALRATPGLQSALDELERARKALQNGSPEEAVTRLRAAARQLRQLLENGQVPPPEPPLVVAGYRGATVLDAHGVRIGRVTGVSPATPEVLTVRIGGVRDVFGFFDFGGGTLVEVPLEAVLFGETRPFSHPLVGIPAFDAHRPAAG